MGWASEALERDLARCGIFPVQNRMEDYLPPYRDVEPKEKERLKKDTIEKEPTVEEVLEDEMLEYINNSYTEEIEQDKIFDNIEMRFVKYGQGNHIATFNMVVGDLMTIKYLRLFKNPNTSEYSLAFPSFKCGDNYITFISAKKELYNQILQDCINLIK